MTTLMIIGFLVIFGISLLAISLGVSYVEKERSAQVDKALRVVKGPHGEMFDADLVKEAALHDQEDSPFLILPGAGRLNKMLRQSGLEWSLGSLIWMISGGIVIGAVLGSLVPILIFWVLTAIVLGILGGLLPVIYVSRTRAKRLAEFEEQFPEALDFLARSMQAGHAFTVSLGMLADESVPPLGEEFRTVYNEHNLGSDLNVALRRLSERIPILDVRFFVASVLLQREVGGNMSEILLNLAYIIRERFRLKGHVKAVSAHGRLTASILTIMPIIVLILMMLVAPSYIPSMIEDPDGKYLLLIGAVLQIVGFYFIRKIVNIKI